jgi:DNA-binding winged helix-turn-helix (wHTH) protein/tetratricopeptide (TPR) repeat protein
VTATGYQFGPFHFDRVAYQVARGDEIVALTPKLLDLLVYLLERPATLVTKEELLDALWPEANVTENALAQAMSELRQGLGDEASAPQFIRTVARRGYRFIAPVTPLTAPATTPAVAIASRPGKGTSSTVALPESGARGIAVLDFAQMAPDPGAAWLSAGIAETVTNDLSRLGHFRVVDRRRVLEAARATDGSLEQIAAALGAQLIVVGSVQQSQQRVRITSRIVDVTSGEAIADAKVDGAFDDIFNLQDEVVRQLSREMALPDRTWSSRDTTSLKAFQAFTEGWLALESLEVDRMAEAVGKFEHAVAADPRYARAYAGLASAELACFESTRADNEPQQQLLARAVSHAREAVALDAALAEAHATLAMLLVSAGETEAAGIAGRRAVTIEPANWRHWFRLGHASWGSERVRAAAHTQSLYPEFAFSHFQVAMVHVARRALTDAETVLRQGAAVQDRQIARGGRYPALGLHWLLGLVRLSLGDVDEALEEFSREAALAETRRLYGREFQLHAGTARAAALMRAGRVEEAISSYRGALAHYPDNAAANVGLAGALSAIGRMAEAEERRGRAEAVLPTLERTRPVAAAVARAELLVATGQAEIAAQLLASALTGAPPGFACWTVPIEPAFQHVIGLPVFAPFLQELGARAR